MTGEVCFTFIKRLTLAIVLISLLALIIPTSVTMADDEVDFPDANLEAAILEEIGKTDPPIYQSDLAGLTHLMAYDRDIIDLTGLEYCTSLTTLWLQGNQISDIAPLSTLVNLLTLYLGWNPLSGISPLSNLTSLTELGLHQVQISDISALSGLTSLSNLYLSGNQISDITALSGLTSLTNLYLNVNQIGNVSPLVANAGLSEGDLVVLCDNPLSADSVNIYIPELQGRGVFVTCPFAPHEGCFIATAAYGTSTAAEIDTLRAFRDEVLLESGLGRQLVDFYYKVSPPVADFISEHEELRTLVREVLVDPVVWAVEAMEALWRD